MGVAELIEREEKALERHLAWIRQVDVKAQQFSALDVLMIGSALALASDLLRFGPWVASTVVLGILLPACALVRAASASFPNVVGPDRSLIFFGRVAALSREEYCRRVRQQSDAQYLVDLAQQAHQNAVIASTKYRSLRQAIDWTLLGLGPWLISTTVLAMLKSLT